MMNLKEIFINLFFHGVMIKMTKLWVQDNLFTSHQVVNEIVTIAGLFVLRKFLLKIKEGSGSSWFSVIADETIDVVSNKQMNVRIWWVNDSYEV